MPYSLAILWRDRYRFIPAVLAVAFSAVLIAVQCGLVLGLLLCTSITIDRSSADIWVLTPNAYSLQQAYPISDTWLLRVIQQPEIDRAETLVVGSGAWRKPQIGRTELCFLVGMHVDEGSLGLIEDISPKMRSLLTEPGTVVIDKWELDNLGLDEGIGERVEINKQRVKVVGLVHGYHGHNFSYVFCSHDTARQLVGPGQLDPLNTMCVLAKCRPGEDATAVVQQLRRKYPHMGFFTKNELSWRAQMYWLFRSSGGTVMICTITLALLVGLVVTSQTLSSAVLAARREFALLESLGIPRWRLIVLVLAQSFWIGLLGLLLAAPVVFVLRWAAVLIQTRILLPKELLIATAALTMAIALLSGASALRALRSADPAILLR